MGSRFMRRVRLRFATSGLIKLGLLLQVSVAVAVVPAATIKIPDSTPIRLTITDRLNSASSEIDDPVHLEVTEDVKVRGIVVIPRGSMASGHVTAVQHRQRMGRAGKLEFSVDFVRAPDGTDITVRAKSAREGKNKRSVAPSPLHLLERGKDLEIPQGTHFVAYVNGDHEISLGNNSPPAALQAAGQTAATSTTSDISSVVVTSTPDYADITVDGKFLGTTPSTVRMTPGDHSVTIEKTGFKAWQRVMTLTAGGKITLDVTLDKIP